jgi:site-specific DNA-methyltransferase (adenine-specific)
MNEDTNIQTPTQPPLVIPDVSRCPFSIVFNEDCVQGLKRFADNYFDLAIVDPPYGINVAKTGKVGGNNAGKAKDYGAKEWDKQPPDDEYFRQLFRVSKNQIIWGANHFISKMPFDSSCWLVWDKDNSGNFADCELAWTSFDRNTKKVEIQHHGFLTKDGKSIHPTQKPVMLYEWTLMNFAKDGDKILDTHFGSGSIALAVDKANRLDKMNLHLTACEIDKEYIDKAIKRISESIKQCTLSF